MLVSTIQAGPMMDVQNSVHSIHDNIIQQVNALRSQLDNLKTLLADQKKSVLDQKVGIDKQSTKIQSGKKTIENARKDIEKNKLLPKDVKTPLLEMFSYQDDLLDQLKKTITLAQNTMQQVADKVPGTIKTIATVGNDVRDYEKVVGEGFVIVEAAIKPLADAEKVVHKTGEVIEETGKKVEKFFSDLF